MQFRNRFGWSLSRQALFEECRRRYFFHYYLSWGGWQKNAPVIVREAFKLKRLITLPLWRGQLVHYVTSKVLKSMKVKGRIPERDEVLRYTAKRFLRQLEFSSARRYLAEPKKRGGRLNIDWLGLIEHEYGRPLETERIERTRQECMQAVEGLFESSIIDRIQETDASSWEIEDLDHAEFSQSFPYEGVTVYMKTDFIFSERDGTFNIVDWKTNRPPDRTGGEMRHDRTARIQLGLYGYHAAIIRGIPVELIRLYEVNLLEGGTATEYTITEEDITLFDEYIRSGISLLSSVLVGGDTERNESCAPDHFPPIENGICSTCNFFRICKDERFPHRLL
ncbi:MAG: PD-(D/E)XK nuclease family protein [bacterium]|nr:MAG: PD-(D/E)XK nuclease family protein [bacterium]